jgi:curved DNA-binding protein
MEFIDYYRELGVDSTADDKTIKTAYRKLGRKYHPDVSKLANSAEKFKRVAQAYEVLHSAEKRAEYDALCAARSRGFQSHGQTGHDAQAKGFTANQQTASNQAFTDFFHAIFGDSGSQHRQQHQQQAPDDNIAHHKAADVELEWPLMLEDTLADSTQHIEFALPVADSLPAQPAVKKALKVKIPAGMRDGERLRLKAQGVPAQGNIAAGDLYLTIRLLPHPWFDVDADNLLLTVPIAPWEAALGAKIMLPTLGGKIQLQIPANSQAGQRLRVKSKGLVRNNTAGDLITMLKIVMPATVNDSSLTLWRQLADSSGFDPRHQWSHLS